MKRKTDSPWFRISALLALGAVGAYTLWQLRRRRDLLRAQCESLLKESEALLKENAELRAHLQATPSIVGSGPHSAHSHPLSNSQIQRYSRQLILADIGVKSQEKFGNTRVLVVGAGGLGAPVLLYLAAAGIGRLGIIDPDNVEIDNLHRQVIHSELTIGKAKAESAKAACLRLNSTVRVDAYVMRFDETNAMDLVRNYDIIVDASDNVATRYLINDAAILSRKPVVSGAALRMEGQVTVYGYNGGPCYRCLFPRPPPPETVTNCADGGVLGAITGIIGCIQALEVLKLAAGRTTDTLSRTLLTFDGTATSFRSIKLRARDTNCAVCGDRPTVKELVNYPEFCRVAMHDKPQGDPYTEAKVALESKLIQGSSISAAAYASLLSVGEPHVLLDVRENVQYDICSLPVSTIFPNKSSTPSLVTLNIPFRELPQRYSELMEALEKVQPLSRQYAGQHPVNKSSATSKDEVPLFIVCRRGIDSARATAWLTAHPRSDSVLQTPTSSQDKDKPVKEVAFRPMNISGGLSSWARNVDKNFPLY